MRSARSQRLAVSFDAMETVPCFGLASEFQCLYSHIENAKLLDSLSQLYRKSIEEVKGSVLAGDVESQRASRRHAVDGGKKIPLSTGRKTRCVSKVLIKNEKKKDCKENVEGISE